MLNVSCSAAIHILYNTLKKGLIFNVIVYMSIRNVMDIFVLFNLQKKQYFLLQLSITKKNNIKALPV